MPSVMSATAAPQPPPTTIAVGTMSAVPRSRAISAVDGNPNLAQNDLVDQVTVDLRAGLAFGPVATQVFVRNLLDDPGAFATYTALALLPAAGSV